MEKITNIYRACSDSLDSLSKKIKFEINKYANTLDSPTKAELKKYNDITNAFTQFQSDCTEIKYNSKNIISLIKYFMSSGCGLEEIDEAQREYNRTKQSIILQFGFISKALHDADLQFDIDKYFDACDQLPKINAIIQSTEVVDINLEDEDFLVDDSTSTKVDYSTSVNNISSTSKMDNPSTKDDDFIQLSSEKKKHANNTNWDEEIKNGGLNQQSTESVTIGGNEVVVGERAKYFIRDKLLRLKQADEEGQLEIFKMDMDELEEKCKRVIKDPKSHMMELAKEFELDELYQQSLVDLKSRIKACYKQYSKSNISVSNVDASFQKLISEIDEYDGTYSLQPNLFKVAKCINALKEQSTVAKCKSHQSLENLIKQTKKDVESIKSIELVENPGKWECDDIDIGNVSIDDPVRCLAKIERNLVPYLTELELYYAHLSEYIDQQWVVDDINVESIKYRLYIMSLIKNIPDDIKSQIDSLVKKYNVGNYSKFVNFCKTTF